MSDLLALTDYDSAEFIGRIRGIFAHSMLLAMRAQNLNSQVEKRVGGMKRHMFDGLAEIGEALLRVQEARPGEFEDWFSIHEEQLGFSLRSAERCKSAGKMVREFGADKAYERSLERPKSTTQPLLCLTFRLTKPPEQMDAAEREHAIRRLEPMAALLQQLQAMQQSIGQN